MPFPVELVDGNGRVVILNDSGEIPVAQGPYDESVFNELAEPNIAYNFFKPSNGNRFIMTGFLAYGDKQVNSVTNSTVIIYEASQVDSTTVDKVIIQFEIGQNQSVPFPNIRKISNKGVYINAKCDDDDVHMTIFGHFIHGT